MKKVIGDKLNGLISVCIKLFGFFLTAFQTINSILHVGALLVITIATL